MEEKVWAGVDVGKGFHWAHVVDGSGKELLSRRVEDDEADLLALINEAFALADARGVQEGLRRLRRYLDSGAWLKRYKSVLERFEAGCRFLRAG